MTVYDAIALKLYEEWLAGTQGSDRFARIVAQRMRELVEPLQARLNIALAEAPVDEVEEHFRALRAELAALRQTNQELWGALTPEKRHELNLAAKDSK